MENKTEKQAAENKNVLLQTAEQNKTIPESVEGSLLAQAYENEVDIEHKTKNLQQSIESAICRLQENLRYLQRGEIRCMSSCGILQGLNHDIDSGIVELKLLTKGRKFYSEYLED